MGRAMAAVVIVAIIAAAVLIAVRMVHRAGDRRKALHQAAHDLHAARSTITRIEGELALQIEARHYDPNPLLDIVKDYRKDPTP